jgi:hypothetical protein
MYAGASDDPHPFKATRNQCFSKQNQAIWSPYLKKNIRKAVQRRPTKKVVSLKHLEYPVRLQVLGLPTLGDMIETYKIMHKIYDERTSLQLVPMTSNLR